jgi:hypothetical protein
MSNKGLTMSRRQATVYELEAGELIGPTVLRTKFNITHEQPVPERIDFTQKGCFDVICDTELPVSYRNKIAVALLSTIARAGLDPDGFAAKYELSADQVRAVLGMQQSDPSSRDRTAQQDGETKAGIYVLPVFTSVRREATSGETALGVENDARAIASFIHSAIGELCFAVFGAWGRGKTFLVRLIANRLASENSYVIVWFNAWKYRSRPEIWAYLYHSFVEAYTAAGRTTLGQWLVRYSLAIRASVIKLGFLPVATAFWTTQILVIPAAYLYGMIFIFIAVVGLAWSLLMLHLYRSTSSVSASIERFVRLADHRMQLGAQATIGKDLQCLSVAAMPKAAFGSQYQLFGMVLLMIAVPAAVTWLVSQLAAIKTGSWFVDYILSLLFTSTTPNLAWAVAIWWLWYGLTLACVLLLPSVKEKALLIVDDLDRCEPQQMLEIIESIKLLLEDPLIQQRVQVVMLVQEGHLRAAISTKFAPYQTASSDGVERSVIEDEHAEKLFAAHFRFAGISPMDARILAKRHIDHEQALAADRIREEIEQIASDDPRCAVMLEMLGICGTLADEPEDEPINNLDPVDSLARGTRLPKVMKYVESSMLPYTEKEMRELPAVIKRLAINMAGMRDVSPRYIRSFLFKYQLARLLLNARDNGSMWLGEDQILIRTLALACEYHHSRSDEQRKELDQIPASIVEAVTQVV